jgi:hypothetical protein
LHLVGRSSTAWTTCPVTNSNSYNRGSDWYSLSHCTDP